MLKILSGPNIFVICTVGQSGISVGIAKFSDGLWRGITSGTSGYLSVAVPNVNANYNATSLTNAFMIGGQVQTVPYQISLSNNYIATANSVYLVFRKTHINSY